MVSNCTILKGRLTKDPVFKKVGANGDTSFVMFSIAVKRRTKPGAEPEADFFNCKAWRAQADAIAKFFKKGSGIAVQGELHTDNYEKNGVKYSATTVEVDNFDFTDPRSKSDAEQNVPEDDGLPY